jgi:hypothetical protein
VFFLVLNQVSVFMSHIKERQVEYFFRTAEIVKYLGLMFSSLVYFLSKAVLFSLRNLKNMPDLTGILFYFESSRQYERETLIYSFYSGNIRPISFMLETYLFAHVAKI